MQKIVPHLWYDTEAADAARLYTSLFGSSSIKDTAILENTPSGRVEVLTISLSGQDFSLISAGPFFNFTPAVSFTVACDTMKEVDRLWEGLREGGKDLMPLGAYPFNERYGWLSDRYGLSWQILFAGEGRTARKITPTLMFTGEVAGRAEEAMGFWTSIFADSGLRDVTRYGRGEETDREGTIQHAAFTLAGEAFAAMDSGRKHDFGFNEAISFVVRCDSQDEIDRYWERLSAYPETEQCGWLKDKFGFSWQIVPRLMDEMMRDKDRARLARVTEAFLKMKKFDIADLKRAYGGGES